MKIIIIAALLLPTFSYAEEAAPADKPADTAPPATQPAPAAPTTQPTEWYLRVDQAGINALSQCIQELPKKIADPFLFNLDAQLRSQDKIKAEIKGK